MSRRGMREREGEGERQGEGAGEGQRQGEEELQEEHLAIKKDGHTQEVRLSQT